MNEGSLSCDVFGMVPVDEGFVTKGEIQGNFTLALQLNRVTGMVGYLVMSVKIVINNQPYPGLE